jgi:hypothetical protein
MIGSARHRAQVISGICTQAREQGDLVQEGGD